MLDVEIKNFQSIAHLALQIEGFTTLVGSSNIGKSALVRAIKCALTNSVGVGFVRHDDSTCARSLRNNKTCKCATSVHLRMPNIDLLWEKGDAINRYTFNGQIYDRPGVGIPDFLTSNGFGSVKIGDTIGSIQIADQFFPIFMLNQSGPSVAEAISDVARLDRINKAMRLSEKDRREVVSTKKVREKDVTELKTKLTVYEHLDRDAERTQLVVKNFSAVRAKNSFIELITHYADSVSRFVARIRQLWEVGSVHIPEIHPVTATVDKVKTLERFNADKERRVLAYQGVAWVEKFLRAVPEIDDLLAARQRVNRFEGWITRLRSFRDRFLTLEAIQKLRLSEPAEVVKAGSQVRELDAFASKYETLTSRLEVLEQELQHTLAEERVLVLGIFASKYERLITHEGVLEQELNVMEAEQGLLDEEVQEIGVCPTCTNPLRRTEQHAHA